MPDLPLARFRATLHYDGSEFRGWQLQPEGRTVQGEVERALSRLLSAERRVTAAGRTDAGVHAVGQEISFEAPASWAPSDLHRGLNALLPGDVWVERLREAEPGFHPRFGALARRYEYLASDSAEGCSPCLRRRLWALGPPPLDPEALTSISRPVLGLRSFAAFRKSGQPERGTRCRVDEARWDRSPVGWLHFSIVADRFLHRMVRYLVSTLIEVAVGRRGPDEIEALLAGDESLVGGNARQARAPVPAPACGLYLTGVRYSDGWNRSPGIPGSVPTPRHGDPGGP